ncbi:hypothetical protein CA13_51730 [Planctomycetes bacterium CA13]|uniref:Uncharacterized protein n=1 Tax=Novipirellula herctigrandis TaxID=2527986 RepID=A0A5C5Z9E7_9BACT|nr:hypothetical protein CA13_51730 [Planctomycetes bacterium CA13]
MVTERSKAKLDPVAKRLLGACDSIAGDSPGGDTACSGSVRPGETRPGETRPAEASVDLPTDSQSANAIEWLERQHVRRAMIWRARSCTISSWLMVAVAAIVGSVIGVKLSMDVYQMASEMGLDDVYGHSGWRLFWIPGLMVVVSLVVVVGGIIGAFFGFFPGYRSTSSAIDWSTATDAVTRLLAVGCTYPEAYSTAAKVVQNRTSRTWLTETAMRVERGETVRGVSPYSRNDVAMLESLIDPTGENPTQQWQLASDHFYRVAKGRLTLLTQSMPFLSTVVAGFIIWFAISSSLGWFWVTVTRLIGGLT